ncbi:hypothetical protein V8F06_007408 [Rhypophila decipiens]
MSQSSNSIWQQHRHLFRRLYLEDDNQLKDVKVIAERDHSFPRTPLSTYEAKLRDELKLRKNLTPEDWAFIGRDLKSRCGRYAVLLCGVRISDDKNNHAIFSAFAQDANSGASWGPDSLRSVEDIEMIEYMDAANLGLLPHFASNNGFLSSNPGDAHYECQLSTFRDPFHALIILLHRLSNTTNSTGSFYELMDETFCQIPTSLLALLFGIDCPTVRAAWGHLLDWTSVNDDQDSFHVLAEVMLKDNTASVYPRTLSKLLCLAAWFGITDLCTILIQNGASLTRKHRVRERRGPLMLITDEYYRPLTAAAVRGSVEVVKLILGTGVNVYTAKSAEHAVGRVLRRVKESNQDRQRLLHILSLLLAAETDVYTLSKGFDPIAVRTGHHLNLLDVACLSGDTEVIELFLPYKREKYMSFMTVSGIIMAAMDGSKAFSHYLTSAPDPTEEHGRLSMESYALFISLEKQDFKSCSIMMKARFGRDPSFVWHFKDFENKPSLTSEPRVDSIIPQFVKRVFQDSPLTAESEEIATLILSDPLWTIFRRHLIHACLKNLHQEMWQYILKHPIIRETIDTVVMMALAIRLNNLAVVDFLLRPPFRMNVNAEVHYCNQRYSVLFLLAGSSSKDFPLTWVMSGSLPAGSSALEDLVRRGADISTCHTRYWSQQHWVAGKQLLWLLEKGLLAHGLTSVYGLLLPQMHMPRMQTKYLIKINLEDSNIVEWLSHWDRPSKYPYISDIVQVLLEAGAKPTGDELAIACSLGNLDLVKLLLDWNANVNPSTPAEWPALSAAASSGSLPIILLLLAAGAVVEPEIDDISESPLVAAAHGGALDVVFLLMQLETREHVIACAMEEAYSRGHLEVSFQLKQLLYRRKSGSTGVTQQ